MAESGWRESDVFTPLERDVLKYAEAMTHTPPTVTDELSARLLAALGAPALVELTAYICPGEPLLPHQHRLRHRVARTRSVVRVAVARRAERRPALTVVNRVALAEPGRLALQDDFSRRRALLRCERSAPPGALLGRRPGLGDGRRPPRRHRAPAVDGRVR